MQRQIVESGLSLLEEATEARTTRQTPFVWSDDSSWKDNYMKVDASNLEQLKRLGEARKATQNQAKQQGFSRTE
jgi:hypothetical protein